jgi:hypothetical protein
MIKQKVLYFYIGLFFLISLSPFLTLLIDDYSHFYIFDTITVETVNFYLTKSYSFLNNFSFFYIEKVTDYRILNQHDIVPNLVHSLFILIFSEKSTIFLQVFLFFITLVLIFYINVKFFKFNPDVSGTLAIILFIFHTIGPESVKTFVNFFLMTKDHQFNFFRYNFPLINTFLFLIYLIIFFKDYKKKKISKKLIFITIINGFSYFYTAVFAVLNNFLYIALLILRKNFFIQNLNKIFFFFLINFFIAINFIYLKDLHSSFISHNLSIKLFFSLKHILTNFSFEFYRDNLVSFIIIVISFLFYFYLKKNIFIKIIYFHLLLNFLTLIELFGIEMGGFHFDQYILRPLNIISVTFIIFSLFKKNINFLLKLISFILVFTFCISNYNFYKKINLLQKNNLNFQKKVITDLKKFNKVFEIEQITQKEEKKIRGRGVVVEVFITSPYASSIFTSLNHKNKNKIYVSNGSTMRSNELSIKENVENFISFCKFFYFNDKDCYSLIYDYTEIDKLSSFADLMGDRNYPSYNEFLNLYSKESTSLKSNKQLFIIDKSNKYYDLFTSKLRNDNYKLIEGDELILFVPK